MKEFADVINWLRSPEGEQWSRDRIAEYNGVYYGCDEYEYYRGFFSLKRDDLKGYSSSMDWGRLPGDDRLAAEALKAQS